MIVVLDRIARRFISFAQLGAVVVAVHAIAGAASGFGVLSVLGLFWLLASCVIVPLALALYAQARASLPSRRLLDLARWAYVPSMAAVVASIHVGDGALAGALAVPWLMTCSLAGLAALQSLIVRRSAALGELVLDIAFVYLVLGAGFFVLYRSGVRLSGFTPTLAALAHSHWTVAGFTACLLNGLALRWLTSVGSPWRRVVAPASIAALLGPLGVVGLIALGVGRLATVLAVAMEAGHIVLGVVVLVVIARRAPRFAGGLLAVSALCLIGAMSLAAAYTLQYAFDARWISTDAMAWSHAFLNGLGTAVIGLCGWASLTAEELVPSAMVPPGRDGWPLLGETLRFARDPLVFLDSRFRQYGPVFRTSVLGDPCVILVGPAPLTVLTDESIFHRGPANPFNFRQLFNWNASAMIDGPDRARRKDILVQAFHNPVAIDGYLTLCQPIYQGFVERWEKLGRFHWIADHWVVGWQVASTLYLGAEHRPVSLDVPLPVDPGKHVIDDLIAGFGALPIPLSFTQYGRALQGLRDAMKLIGDAAARRRATPERPDAMKRLLEARDASGNGLSLEELETEVIQLFHLSFLTLPGVLNPMVMAIALHPELRDRLRAEVHAQSPSGPVTLDVLHRMPGVLRFTREVRRFYPLVANTLFTQIQKPVEIGGYRLPTGWRALGALHTSMMDEASFPDPTVFDPDRFAPPRSEGDRENAYVPHGPGRPERSHKCPGEPWSDAFLSMCIVVLLRAHEWDLPDQDLELDTSNILAVPTQKSGLVAVMRRIDVS